MKIFIFLKKTISGIFCVFGLFIPQITQAQGTTYLSNLGEPSTGSVSVGSDSWLAVAFFTGTNVSGYSLNSIQLAMTDASGNPSGFTVMLCGFNGLPGSSLGTLSGSTDPSTAGIYTYTPAANLTLLPRAGYSIVLTAGTAVADGAYGWSYGSYAGNNTYNQSGGWGTFVDVYALGEIYTSTDGLSWGMHANGFFSNPQFAINATAVPEPNILSLLGLGGLGFLWHRRKAKTVYGLALTFICSL
jgi:hypothetical protein